jgi:hypothetical protein
VEQDRAKHREEEAQRALDRLVGDVVTEGTHAV